jgi:YidC/Oxa1 family membrane protein insertase
MFDLIASLLAWFYELNNSYVVAIVALTLVVLLISTPLTLQGTRSMLKMQLLQPELKAIQNKYDKDEREEMNAEMMAFYKENNINPVSGCLPLLLQMPVFFLLYRTLFELLQKAPWGQDMGAASVRTVDGRNGGVFEQFGYFEPKHLNESSQLFQDLSNSRVMESFGLDLADSAQKALRSGFGSAWPYILLVLFVTATSYIQQKQVSGRNTQAQVNPQQQMLMRIMPLFFAFISFTLPAGIVVYFLVSNLFRVAQQALITRTMYRDTEGTVDTTGRESNKSSTESAESAAKPKGFFTQLKELGIPNPAEAKREVQASKAKQSNGSKNSTTKTPVKASSGPSRSAPSAANRSKSKKKRK